MMKKKIVKAKYVLYIVMVLATKRKCLHAFDFIIAFVVENARDPECHAPRIAAGSAENER